MERLKKIGNVVSVHSSAVRKSTLGIGFEKLDRNVFDPEKAYDKVAALGVKWARIQSGWARTEKEKGVYDFAWLDSIVDNLVQRGLSPWLCLCYGNGLYDADAAKVFGAVGCPPIKTPEQKEAWYNYVKATVKRYTGKIEWFEIWNEPDGEWCWKHGVNATEYGEFVLATAAAIREANPNAKVTGGASCRHTDLRWITDVIETGAVKQLDGFSYHGYCPDERNSVHFPRAVKLLCQAENPDLKFIQGETGAQSRSDGAGAMRIYSWTPLKQAKFLLRMLISHLREDLFINSYFSCMDMIEALNGKVDDRKSYMDYGYFGVLGADFDENGFATGEYSPKIAYRALQVLASIFREEFELKELPVSMITLPSPRVGMDEEWWDITSQGFVKPNGSSAFVYWRPVELMKYTLESTTTIQCANLKGTPRLIDLLDGAVYEIPPSIMQDKGKGVITFEHLPVTDSPLLLTFGDFAEFQ